MTDIRPICAKCQYSMLPEKNGVKVKYSSDSAQHGDLYRCPICGYEVIVGFGEKFRDYDPDNYDFVRNTI